MQKQFEDGTKNTAVGKMSGIVDSDSGKSSPPPRAPRCMPPAFGVLELVSRRLRLLLAGHHLIFRTA